MDPHLRDLRYFVAVAEEQHVTRAAQRLYVSQPALSKQLRALEGRLGFALLERGPRGVVLTAAGRELLPVARELLDTWAAGLERARAASGELGLVLGIQTAIGRGLTRRILTRYGERRPEVRPALRLMSWDDPTAGLLDGSSDVAFLWFSALPAELVAEPVLTEQRWVLLPADSPFAQLERVPFARLADEPFIALPESAGTLRDVWLALDERDRPARIGAVAGSADSVVELVASGVGVAMIAAGNVGLYPRTGVVARPVAGLAAAELVLAWRRADTRPHVLDFVAAVRAVVREGVDDGPA